MTKKFPTDDEILAFMQGATPPVLRRDIARTFKIKGEDRIPLKALLKDMEAAGQISRGRGKSYLIPQTLPSAALVEVIGETPDGEVLARPVKWDFESEPPTIYMEPEKQGHSPFVKGTRLLAKLKPLEDGSYHGKTLRRMGRDDGAIIGFFQTHKKGGRITPVSKKAKFDYEVTSKDTGGAKTNDLVRAEILPDHARGGKKAARVLERLGKIGDPNIISLISIHSLEIPTVFSEATFKETENLSVPELGKREDLRSLPLITIDGADARDFDDAVFAEPTEDGGWHLLVAIADVAHYVRPGSALDKTAYERGNSTYFVDRVVPMLPEALSNDLCSLKPDVERACMAVHMWINKDGELIKQKVVRGLMKSAARTTYEQIQAAKDGQTDEITAPLMESVIKPLYAAYKILLSAREKRGALELDMPERKIELNKKGEVVAITPRMRLDSHKLIEEFMVLANVATAQALESKNKPCIYRVHDKPDAAKVDALREFLRSMSFNLAKGQVLTPDKINTILHKTKDKNESALISTIVLRCQSQAVYSPKNLGHFGLGLERYAHFTSPIRRYADLIVHRSLINAFGLGNDGLTEEESVTLFDIAEQISMTERRSVEAERDSVDRFTAAFLQDRVGVQFAAHISGVSRFGIFVSLDDSGAEGIVPISTLPDDYYIHDEAQHALIGQDRGYVFRLSAPVEVTLMEADPLRGSTVFALAHDRGADIPGFKTTIKTRKKPVSKHRGKRRDNKHKRRKRK